MFTSMPPLTTTAPLRYVSPNLLEARNLELAVPGTYEANTDEVAPFLHPKKEHRQWIEMGFSLVNDR